MDRLGARAGLSVMSGTQPKTPPAPEEEFQQWCMRMGMLPEAAISWMTICRKPKQCFVVYLASEVAFCLIFGVVYVGGMPWPNWRGTVLQGLNTIGTVAYAWRMYRTGPAFARSRSSRWLARFRILPVLTQMALSQAASDHDMPFQSRALTAITAGLGGWCLILAGMCGAVAAAHPPQPYDSVRTPVTEASLTTLRILSTVTDFGVVRVILQQVSTRPDDLWRRLGA